MLLAHARVENSLGHIMQSFVLFQCISCTGVAVSRSYSWSALRYCHCKPCTRFRGVSPVHLLGVKPAEGASPITVTKGEQYVKMVGDQKYGSMEHAFCTECGCALFQSPKGAGFRAVSATTRFCPVA